MIFSFVHSFGNQCAHWLAKQVGLKQTIKQDKLLVGL